MILVTVGTHEQPFNRLIRAVDELAVDGKLREVFCQTGFSTYRPSVPFEALVSFDEMTSLVLNADVVISHGGPGSIIPVLLQRKPLVLVPRQRRFGEHVDDHQVAFCERVASEHGCPIVLDVAGLELAVQNAALAQKRVGDAAALRGSNPRESIATLDSLIVDLVASGRSRRRLRRR